MKRDVKTRRKHNRHSCFSLSLPLCYINIRAPSLAPPSFFWQPWSPAETKWPQCPDSPGHLGLPEVSVSCAHLICASVTQKRMVCFSGYPQVRTTFSHIQEGNLVKATGPQCHYTLGMSQLFTSCELHRVRVIELLEAYLGPEPTSSWQLHYFPWYYMSSLKYLLNQNAMKWD